MPESEKPQSSIDKHSLDGNLSPRELFALALDAENKPSAPSDWQPPAPEEIARLLPQFRIEGFIGRGGMGAVYRGWQTDLDRQVAIKVLPAEMAADGQFVERFRREARAMAKLSHPHIISVYDFGQTSEGHLFFAMEYVEGANLHEIIHGPGLNPEQALSVAGQICLALAYAHGKGVVHRDIKPANVMIDTESHVKVADFGLARLIEGVAESDPQFGASTVTGTVIGTPDYMAPEQKRGHDVDHRADIYSLGVLIYEMLCRETPQGVFEPPSRRTGCDTRIDGIVVKAMQQAPERRYQSTKEMKADVDTARIPVSANSPRDSTEAAKTPTRALTADHGTKPRPTRHLWIFGAIVALACVSAVIIGIVKSKSGIKIREVKNEVLPESATKDAPFINSLGMKFVPVPTGVGANRARKVLFCIWETRVRDYAEFAGSTSVDISWRAPNYYGEPFSRAPDDPVVSMSWNEPNEFCKWLTLKERASGKLPKNAEYRLPTDLEWSAAIGLGEEQGDTPRARSEKGDKNGYPWGKEHPPKEKVGNYADKSFFATHPKRHSLKEYNDGFIFVSPVGSFAPNQFGIYDLSGNVWEWCQDAYDSDERNRVIRGGSFSDDGALLMSSTRVEMRSDRHNACFGFRCVLDLSKSESDVLAAKVPVSPPVTPGGNLASLSKSASEAEKDNFLSSEEADKGWMLLFNGENLDGWRGIPEQWSVRNGAIYTTASAEKGADERESLVWQGGEISDFELKYRARTKRTGTIMYFHCFFSLRCVPIASDCADVCGLDQSIVSDPSAGAIRNGFHSYITVESGEKATLVDGTNASKATKSVKETLLTQEQKLALINNSEWNDYLVRAQGNHIQVSINGSQVVDLLDETTKYRNSGYLAIKAYQFSQLTAEIKNVKLRYINATDTNTVASDLQTDVSEMQPILNLDFTRSPSGFPTGEDNLWHLQSIEGEYQMLSKGRGLGWPSQPPLDGLRVNDFVCEVNARIVSGDGGGWGLGIVGTRTGEKMPWSGVLVGLNGKVSTRTYDDRPEWPWLTAAGIRDRDEYNLLRVEAFGSQIRVFMNGELVMMRVHPRLKPASALALFCFGMTPPQDVRFKSIKVWIPR